MATVDLYGGDAQRVRNQYRTSLGRDASDYEVSGWLTGSYGGGNLDDRLRQIDTSHEAQQRRQSQPQQPSSPFPSPFERPSQPSTPFQPLTPGQNPNTYGTMGVQPQRQAPSLSYGADDMQRLRTGLGNVYLNELGRAASDQELDNWFSGAFGHGSGPQDYDKFVSAIMSSDEARNYRPQFTGDPNLRTLEYWKSQGVPSVNIFDPMTGQLKPGWERSAVGYEWRGQGQPGGQPGANIPAPRTQSFGDVRPWFLQLTQGKRPSPRVLKELEPILNQHGIRLGPPNARGWSDGIILPDGTFYDAIVGATEDGGQGWDLFLPGPGGHGGGAFGSNTELPFAQYNDPHTKLFEELMLSRIAALQSGNDPNLQRLMQFFEQRFNDLQGPGFTGAENEVIRTQALDPIERDRAAAKRRALERISAMGYTPESGIAQQLLQEIENEFDSMRALTQSGLAMNELGRRESRNQHAEGLAGAMYDLPQTRAHEAIALAGNLSNLGPQRLQLAMQAANLGGSPAQNMSTLLQLAQMNQNAAFLNQQDRSAAARSFGVAFADFLDALED